MNGFYNQTAAELDWWARVFSHMDTQTVERLKGEAQSKRPRTLRRILLILFALTVLIVLAMVVATRKSGPNDYAAMRDVSSEAYEQPKNQP